MEKLFGLYKIEKVERNGKIDGYLLHGPRVTYSLLKTANHPHLMYAVNSRFNICSIKGNYTFSDEGGQVKAIS